MVLFLMRHAQATEVISNPLQPLSEEGHKQVTQIIRFIQKNELSVRAVYHSHKLRSEETARTIVDALEPSLPCVLLEALNPMQPVENLSCMISTLPDQCLLVGHLPHLEELVSFLIQKDYYAKIVSLYPASLLCLHSHARGWSLEWLIHPFLL